MSDVALELPPRGLITLFRRPMMLDGRGLTHGKTHLAWDDVEFYTYRWENGHVAGDIYVVAHDDRWLRIDHRYYYWRQAADRILEELHPRLRARPDYHPFRLTDSELRHAAFGTLPLTEIDRVEIVHVGGGPGLVVIRRGSTDDWSTDSLETIHDVVMLLDDLIARGIAVRPSVPLWLPPSVRQISEGFASEVSLPQARLIRR